VVVGEPLVEERMVVGDPLFMGAKVRCSGARLAPLGLALVQLGHHHPQLPVQAAFPAPQPVDGAVDSAGAESTAPEKIDGDAVRGGIFGCGIGQAFARRAVVVLTQHARGFGAKGFEQRVFRCRRAAEAPDERGGAGNQRLQIRRLGLELIVEPVQHLDVVAPAPPIIGAVKANRPWRTALWRMRSLPTRVRGPMLWRALARDDAAWAGLRGIGPGRREDHISAVSSMGGSPGQE